MSKRLQTLSLVKQPDGDHVTTDKKTKPIPELDKDVFIRAMFRLGSLTEPARSQYLVRFTEGSREYAPGRATIEVATHHRGTKFSPLSIERVLQKFRIDREEFLMMLERM